MYERGCHQTVDWQAYLDFCCWYMAFKTTCDILCYRILPNYRSMHLGFSKALGKLVVKYVSFYTKGTLKQRSAKDLSNDAYAMFLCFLFLISFIKAYVVGTHLNCIDKSMQFKWVPTTYAFIQ